MVALSSGLRGLTPAFVCARKVYILCPLNMSRIVAKALETRVRLVSFSFHNQ